MFRSLEIGFTKTMPLKLSVGNMHPFAPDIQYSICPDSATYFGPNPPHKIIKIAIGREQFPIYSNYRGESHAIGLVNSVLKGEPYRIRALIIHGASLLTSWPQTPIWHDTLSKLDFLTCIDRQLTADAAYADIVLPATTMFENESYMTYGPIFRLRERIIEPLGEARNDYLIMAGLADRLGYGHLFPQTEETNDRSQGGRPARP